MPTTIRIALSSLVAVSGALLLAACGSDHDPPYSGEVAEVVVDIPPPSDETSSADSVDAAAEDPPSSAPTYFPTNSSNTSAKSNTAKTSTDKGGKTRGNAAEVYRGKLALTASSCASANPTINAKFPVRRKRSNVSVTLPNGITLTGTGNKSGFSAEVSLPQTGGATVVQALRASRMNKSRSHFALDLTILYADSTSCKASYEGVLKKKV